MGVVDGILNLGIVTGSVTSDKEDDGSSQWTWLIIMFSINRRYRSGVVLPFFSKAGHVEAVIGDKPWYYVDDFWYVEMK